MTQNLITLFYIIVRLIWAKAHQEGFQINSLGLKPEAIEKQFRKGL